MLKNYLKLAFRNFKRRKGHAFINILGLAIAVAACILIGIYVQYELSYDSFYEKGDRIYRVAQTNITPEETTENAMTPFPLAPTLESEFPRLIEKSIRFYSTGDEQITLLNRADTTSFLESDFYFADSTYFDFFDVELLQGNPETALARPLSLVMTREKARRYFGNENPIGKTLSFEGVPDVNLEVTGIIESPPRNAHFQADAIASYESLDVLYSNGSDWLQSWYGQHVWTYVMLKEGVSTGELERQLSGFAKKYFSQEYGQNETIELNLQPVESIHLYSDLDQEMEANSSVFYVYLFSTAALLLLFIACINFMNLATARAAERSREVGMRKALGANRSQLFRQFMGESFMISFVALVIAIILVAAATPFLADFTGKPLVFNPLQNGSLLLGILVLFVIVGVLAGLYPALYLSGYEPKEILRGDSATGRSGSGLRKALVVVQFAMSILLIIGTAIVFLQLNYMQNEKLGFNEEQIVLMPMNQNLIAWEYDSFKERAEKSPAVQSVTGIEKIPGSSKQDYWKIAPAGNAGVQGERNHAIWVLHDFVETFGLEVIAGRSFSEEYSTDNNEAILINRKMAEKLGHKNLQDAIGELFYYTNNQNEKEPMQVIGVVEDFYYTSVKREIKPTVVKLAGNQQYLLGSIGFAAAKLQGGNIQEGLTHLEEVWSEINYIDPFSYTFHNEELEKVYAAEATTSSVMTMFTVLCIIVACLGLFGLASFTSLQRTKEIGIRKTLGASVSSLVLLLSKQYIKLIIIANIIVWPVVYFLAKRWLQDFPQRVNLEWNMLLLCGGVAAASLVICLLTVSYQSIKAALINPVESIRQE